MFENKHSGLSNDEIMKRKEKNKVNKIDTSITKSIKNIFIDNTLTLFNIINILIALLIIFTGSYRNILFLGVIILNTSIGIYQELKAKKTIDNLAILHQQKVAVIRDNKIIKIKQDEVVIDDLLIIKSGEQVIVDGIIIDGDSIECDESALTGESNSVFKEINDFLYSGSFIISGKALMKATKVGKDSFVNSLTLKAKEDKEIQSKLILNLKKIVRFLTFFIIPVGSLLFISNIMDNIEINSAILGTTAAVIGMIPEGLVLITSIALAVGAIRLTKQNVLIKSLGSIETLARVDVMCLDKTGTITTNNLNVIEHINLDNTIDTYNLISHIIHDLNESNPTALAIQKYFKKPTSTWLYKKTVPFSSKRKWSAVQYNDISYYLGAPDFLVKDIPQNIKEKIINYSNNGYRVLALTQSNSELSYDLLCDSKLLALIILEDELRENAKDTLSYFKKENVDLIIISGDYFKTVEAIAKRAGIDSNVKAFDMSSIKDNIDYRELVRNYKIFGRVSPQQKRKLVEALQLNHHTVGMTGDGINDILALKKADCSIVMNNAADATKAIADFILINSNFDSMINVLLEGRRVINNVQKVASLYLTKTVYSIILATLFIFISNPYPFQPIQLTPINALTVGIPSFFLALRPNFSLIKGNFLKNALEPSIASGVSVVIYVLIIQYLATILNLSQQEISTLSVLLTGLVSFMALYYIASPLNTLIKIMIISLLIIFIFIFLFFYKFLLLTSIINLNLAIIYIPLSLSIPVLFYNLKKLAKKILKN